MKQEIRKLFIMHTDASVVQPAGGAELLDIHGGYQKNAPFIGGLGGQIQQLYYVATAILKDYEADLVEYYNRAREDPADVNLKKP